MKYIVLECFGGAEYVAVVPDEDGFDAFGGEHVGKRQSLGTQKAGDDLSKPVVAIGGAGC